MCTADYRGMRLRAKAILGLVHLDAWLALFTLWPGGTFAYWQAWVFLAVFTACALAITVWLMKHDPALLERRTKVGPVAEADASQKLIQSIASLAFLALFVVSGLDHRCGWTQVPVPLVVLGDLLVALGLYLVLRVFGENTFTSATIETAPEQRVISTGPYALVRHPMYVGALVMLSGVPLALGSVVGLVVLVPMTLAIMARAIAEERFLDAHLPGYAGYRGRVRYRFVPRVW
jgi:protein-S-isoprenylcysteine O-methyltransferase Ste14